MKKAADMTRLELASYIDQSVLKPEFTQAEIKRYIQEGIDYGCKTVCINPASLPLAKILCANSKTLICVVSDFPFGLSDSASKVAQAAHILSQGGVDEVDVVANYGHIKSGLWDNVKAELKAVADACHSKGAILKVILETDALTLEETIKGTQVICDAEADYAKTSTGFYTGGPSLGATPEVIQAMLQAANHRCKIKASGGIRTRERFFELIDLGIDRAGIGYKSTPVVIGI
ncbi:MAG: deoxyribose-phosphate aldolase [Clostridiales bacterium]|jgi:deoxyribose-phosphate aldolase|nr:deoxyribose-phosphate aldolase [Clostridiales bacterium]